MGGIVAELVEEYIAKNKGKIKEFTEKENLDDIMKMSEQVFQEWDNEEDEIYNDM